MKVVVLFGGNSNEHDISCKSAKTILENIDKNLFDVTSVGIKDNWYIFDDDYSYLENGNWLESNIIRIDNVLDFLKKFDIVFPIIHGTTCEDGKIQGMLDLFNIKYVGCDSISNIISYDKDLTKKILSYYNIPQVNYVTIKKDYDIKDITNKLNFPMIIKPSKCGSSIGISKVNNKKELKEKIEYAFNFDDKVVIEEFINTRELECAIREDKKIIVSDIGEIISSNELYDFDAKYNSNDSKTIIDADIPNNIKKQIKDLSKKIFKVLGCKGMARIDFFYNDKVYFNEINTVPGFTTISMYPMLLTNSKFSIKDLITSLIKSSF